MVIDRDSAARWIQQRHTGANEGKGIVGWSGVATARFRGDDIALQALDLVMKMGNFSATKREEIEQTFPITTLDRLLSTPSVRDLIGIRADKRQLSTDLPKLELYKILHKIVTDLQENIINVNGLKTKEQQVKYVSGLEEFLPDLSTRNGVFRAIVQDDAKDDLEEALPEATVIPTETLANLKAMRIRPRTKLIPPDCKLNIYIPKIRKIEKELRSMQLTSYPNAISTLLRVFLELSVDAYLGRNNQSITIVVKGGQVKDKVLKNKITECLTLLVSAGVPTKDLEGLRIGTTSPNSPLSIDTLHGYIHNAHVGAIEADLTTAFDNARPFFEGIWK